MAASVVEEIRLVADTFLEFVLILLLLLFAVVAMNIRMLCIDSDDCLALCLCFFNSWG